MEMMNDLAKDLVTSGTSKDPLRSLMVPSKETHISWQHVDCFLHQGGSSFDVSEPSASKNHKEAARCDSQCNADVMDVLFQSLST